MAFWGRQILRSSSAIYRANPRYNTSLSTVEQCSPDKIDLEDKVAVITGGASGIGFAIAREFLLEGMQCLTIVDNDKIEGAKSLKKLAEEFGEEKVLFFEADVANTEAMDNALRRSVLHFETIDIIVNNAGKCRYLYYLLLLIFLASALFFHLSIMLIDRKVFGSPTPKYFYWVNSYSVVSN